MMNVRVIINTVATIYVVVVAPVDQFRSLSLFLGPQSTVRTQVIRSFSTRYPYHTRFFIPMRHSSSEMLSILSFSCCTSVISPITVCIQICPLESLYFNQLLTQADPRNIIQLWQVSEKTIGCGISVR